MERATEVVPGSCSCPGGSRLHRDYWAKPLIPSHPLFWPPKNHSIAIMTIQSLTAPEWIRWTCSCLAPKSAQCPSVWEDGGDEPEKREEKHTLRERTFGLLPLQLERWTSEGREQLMEGTSNLESWLLAQLLEPRIHRPLHPGSSVIEATKLGSLVLLNLPDLWCPGKTLGKSHSLSREGCLRGWRWHERVLL